MAGFGDSAEPSDRAAFDARLANIAAEAADPESAIHETLVACAEELGSYGGHFWKLGLNGHHVVLLGGEIGDSRSALALSTMRAMRLTTDNSVVGGCMLSGEQTVIEDVLGPQGARTPAMRYMADLLGGSVIVTPASVSGKRYAFSLGFTAGVSDLTYTAERLREVAIALRPLFRRLRDAEEILLFRRIADASPDPVMITNADPLTPPGPYITYVNAAFERETGFTSAEAVGREPRMLQGAGTSAEASQNIREALMAARPIRQEILNYRKDGTPFWVELHIAPVIDFAGVCSQFVAIERNVTVQKHERERLAASEAELRVLFESNPIPMCVFAPETLALLKLNAAFVGFSGRSRDELPAMSLLDLMLPADHLGLRAALRPTEAADGPGQVNSGPWAHVCSDGTRHVMIATQPTTLAGKHAMMAAFWDVTDKLEADAVRQEMTRRIVNSLESERLHIARELHDQMSQTLTALSLGIARVATANSAAERTERLHTIETLVGDIDRSVNRIATDLRPSALDDIGLREAIRSFLSEWSSKFHLKVDFVLPEQEFADLTGEMKITIFRAMQEALANAVRHAHATAVSVVLHRDHDTLRLIIEDNGQGMEVDSNTSRLGLIGMRERLSLVGGDLAIESEPGQGATLYITVPLARAEPRPSQ